MKSVPPTTLIAAFDAVARLHSFNRAADELSLSNSTVSHRIRELETILGSSLFSRTTRVVKLTTEGTRLHQQIKGALSTLEEVFGNHVQKREVVRITALPSFARFRLIPALARLSSNSPAPTVEIHPSTDLVDVDKGEADIAIRFSRHRPTAHHCEKLMDDEWFPVAAPGYLERLGAPASHRVFRTASLLAHTRQPWKSWMEKAGIEMQTARQKMIFTDTGFVLDAALAQQGVALVRRSLVHDLLEAGSLVRISDISVQAEQSYYLLASERAIRTPHGKAVMRWVQALCTQGASSLSAPA